jgi:hypothetical protein
MSQAGRKRMAAATVNDGLGNGFSEADTKQRRTKRSRVVLPCIAAWGKDDLGVIEAVPAAIAEKGSSHRHRIKIKIIP